MQENIELVQKGFRSLLPPLADYILREMYAVYQKQWWAKVLETLPDQEGLPRGGKTSRELIQELDLANCLRLIKRLWREVFAAKMSINHKTWATELMGVRNEVAHVGTKDFEQSYTERALDTMALLCESFDAQATEEIRALYRKLRYGSEKGSIAVAADGTPKTDASPKKDQGEAAVLTQQVGQNLPSWRHVMQPHPDVAQGRYRAAEFAADLAQVARGEGAYEYRDPVEFFARTYVTEGMAGLLVQSLQRVAGIGGEPVIQLKTAFGGGKTHSMLALYHLLKGKASPEYIPSLKPVLTRAGLSELPKANVAVLVGTALDPTKKKKPLNFPGYSVSTIWGEMAYQLVTSAGKPELYGEYIREADRKGVSPGSENLKNLLNACGPCLILMDELVAYAKKIYGVDGLPAGSFDNFVTFIQEITEAARASENSLVVASIPESEIEIGGVAGATVLATIEHTFGRMEAIWKPVAANEGFEVVRRRLFLNCQNPEAREAVCEAFSGMYQHNAGVFPPETKEVAYQERLISCYPIHPEVFDRLYGDWATLEHFQRTRGVLRLMAAVIHELWMANDAGAMIMPGSVPLDVPQVREELVRHLPDNWNSIIDREVDGRDSIPYRTDHSDVRYGKNLASRRISRTIMLGSAPSTSALRDQGVRGLELSRILLGTVQPAENIATFKDALNTLRVALSYLYSNPTGNRFWYDTKPTLRKTAEDRATQVPVADVAMEIEKRLKQNKKELPFAGLHLCPSSSGDVPDEQTARLVILRPDKPHRRNQNTSNALQTAMTILDHRGNAPRIYRNMLAFLAPDGDRLGALQQEVRRFIAWSTIIADKDSLNLDRQQLREAENHLSICSNHVSARIREAYCWLMVPFTDPYEDMRQVQWEIFDLGGGEDSLVSKAARRMIQNELIITKWAPVLLQMTLDEWLWRDVDELQVKKLWDYLSTYCYLPRLSSYRVLEEAIVAGLPSNEFFGLAAAVDFQKKRYVDLKFNQSVFKINPTDLLVKPQVALAQIHQEEAARQAKQPANQTDGGSISGRNDELHPSPNSETNSCQEKTEDYIIQKPQVSNRYFHMSATLDNTRVNRDINTYVQEIIAHLNEVDGAQVKLRLEVEVDAQNGMPTTTVRTVSENCRTLKVDDFSFDD